MIGNAQCSSNLLATFTGLHILANLGNGAMDPGRLLVYPDYTFDRINKEFELAESYIPRSNSYTAKLVAQQNG